MSEPFSNPFRPGAGHPPPYLAGRDEEKKEFLKFLEQRTVMTNVVLTAHFAGPTSDNHVARFRNAFDNVERVKRGERAFWIVPELLG